MSAWSIVGICVGGYLFSLLSVFIGMILWWLKNRCYKGNNTYTYFDFVYYCKETHKVRVDMFDEICTVFQHKNFWFYNQFIFFSWFPGLNTVFAVVWWVYWIGYIVFKIMKSLCGWIYGIWKNKFLKRLRFKGI